MDEDLGEHTGLVAPSATGASPDVLLMAAGSLALGFCCFSHQLCFTPSRAELMRGSYAFLKQNFKISWIFSCLPPLFSANIILGMF